MNNLRTDNLFHIHTYVICKCSSAGILFVQKLAMTYDDIMATERETRGQSNNPLWRVIRSGRLTASKFGLVLKACRRNKFPPSLFKCLFEQYKLSDSKAIAWGVQNEQTASDKYEKNFGTLDEVGIFMHCSGALAASPDRLEGPDGIVEIKCPFKYRNDDISEALEDSNFFIGVNCSGEFCLKKSH